jgi:hypothetical protein
MLEFHIKIFNIIKNKILRLCEFFVRSAFVINKMRFMSKLAYDVWIASVTALVLIATVKHLLHT